MENEIEKPETKEFSPTDICGSCGNNYKIEEKKEEKEELPRIGDLCNPCNVLKNMSGSIEDVSVIRRNLP